MAEISIIIPVYNVEEYLAECVESILCQTFKDWEIILVNDGSTDGSKNICEEYCTKDSRIRLINKENGGLSSARNAGIENAKGNFITFIDSDDVIIGEDVLERLMNCFDEDKNLDVVQYDVIFKWLSKEEHHRNYPFKTYTNKEDILRGYLEQNIHVSCCDKILRMDVMKDIRFPLGQISEDIAVIPQILKKTNRLKTANIGYYGYRYREGSITTSVLPYKKILSVLKSYTEYINYAMQFKNLRPLATEIYTNTIWAYSSVIRKNYKEQEKDFCKQPHFLKLSFADWWGISKGYNLKLKINSFVSCIFGGNAIFYFQKLFTRG